MFGSVSSSGKLEIWDLEYSVLDPVIKHNVLDRQLTTVAFASQSPVIDVGDDFGAISIFKICKTSTGSNDGIVSPFAKVPLLEKSHQDWKLQESNRLKVVIDAKIASSEEQRILE